jgi:hypothetical protein
VNWNGANDSWCFNFSARNVAIKIYDASLIVDDQRSSYCFRSATSTITIIMVNTTFVCSSNIAVTGADSLLPLL